MYRTLNLYLYVIIKRQNFKHFFSTIHLSDPPLFNYRTMESYLDKLEQLLSSVTQSLVPKLIRSGLKLQVPNLYLYLYLFFLQYIIVKILVYQKILSANSLLLGSIRTTFELVLYGIGLLLSLVITRFNQIMQQSETGQIKNNRKKDKPIKQKNLYLFIWIT